MATESMFKYAERATGVNGLERDLRSKFYNSDRHRAAFGVDKHLDHLKTYSDMMQHLPYPISSHKHLSEAHNLDDFTNNINNMKDMHMDKNKIKDYITKYETKCSCPRKRLFDGSVMRNCVC
jgi:hypothetical protein